MTELQLGVSPAGNSITNITHLSSLRLLGAPDRQGEVARGGNECRCRGKTPLRHCQVRRKGAQRSGGAARGSFPSRLFLGKLYLEFLSVLHSSSPPNTHLPVAPAQAFFSKLPPCSWLSLRVPGLVSWCIRCILPAFLPIFLVLLIFCLHPGQQSLFCSSLSLTAISPGLGCR